MTYRFVPAVRQNAALMLGLAGPSGSGKTFSALRLATGLANGGTIAMIDTENGRGLHYADQFDYTHANMPAPFGPENYREAIAAALDTKPAVVVVDSMSHEHEGEGGILEMHEAELKRMAGDDYTKRERVKFSAWIKPKAQHNKLVNFILQANVHFIFCFRAKDKLAMVKNDRGKQEPVSMGWQPICSDRFEYEMAALLLLPPGSEGVPDLTAKACKVQQQHRDYFPAGQQLTEDTGKKLAAWAAGGKRKKANGKATKELAGDDPAPPAEEPQPTPPGHQTASSPEATSAGGTNDLPTVEDAKMEALQGEQHLRGWYKGLSQKGKKAIYDRLEDLMATARRVDAEKARASSDQTFGDGK